MDILADIKETLEKGLQEAKFLNTANTVEAWRVKYLGRAGAVSRLSKNLARLSEKERPRAGKALNELKTKFQKVLEEHAVVPGAGREEHGFDVTRPATRKIETGSLHPLTLVLRDVKKIFFSFGFSVVTGPEIETDYYNFDALNIPKYHPARDMWDTLWLKTQNQTANSKQQKLLLRTHTSPVQVRFMEKHQPPLKIIVPGTVYRHEAIDASHSFQFGQVEGLMVDENVSLANFKYIIEKFFEKFFNNRKIEFRFLPSFYPFVEPGLDVAIKWKGEYLEVAGAGMVHPEVFRAAGYGPREFQGFAFGFGLNRLAMIKYNIPDIRLFYENDIRFLKQFL